MSLVSKFIPGDPVISRLYKAIFSGDIDKVNSIIDSHGLSHCPNWAEGQDLLRTAIECKHLEIVKLLVKRGCKIEYKEGDDVPNILKETLCLTVNQGDCECLSLFLDRISETQSRVKLLDSLNVLHTAVSNKNIEVVKLLLSYGADFDCKTKDGELTPLHVAAVNGNEEIVDLLLDAGSNLESKDTKGNTSLALAVANGNVDVVKTLVTRGADCNSKNNLGKSPLIEATRKNEDARYLQIVEDLLTFGADVNYNYSGMTPLHLACMMRNIHLIPLLLDAGADVNSTDFLKSLPSLNSRSDLIAKQRAIFKTNGIYLRKEIKARCHNAIQNGMLCLITASTTKSCEEELSKMKTVKSSNGVALYEIFQNLKNPLSLISENEIKFLKSIELEYDFPMYESIIRYSLKIAKLRNELISLGQDWLLYLIENRQDDVTFLPEEMRIHILSFLTNEDIKTLIQCGEEIHEQKN